MSIKKLIPLNISLKIHVKFLSLCYTAEGKAVTDSDIDIAVDDIAPEEYFKIWNLLTEAIDGYFIDLRDIRGKNNFFAQRVRKYGIKL